MKLDGLEFADKTEYMAALRDKNRVEAIKARANINDPRVAAKLYERLKTQPYYFETELGRRFVRELKPIANSPVVRNSEIIRQKNPESKIRIVEGSEELKGIYNNEPTDRKAKERAKALNELTESGREFNDFWDEKSASEGNEADNPEAGLAGKKKKMKLLLASVGSLAAIVLAVVLIREIDYRIDVSRSNKKLAELQNLVLQAANASNTVLNEGNTIPVHAADSGTTQAPEEHPAQPSLLAEYAGLYSRNNDLVGWIKIPDTIVNYPVMQTKSNMEYYLKRDFDGKNDVCGLPFVDSRSDVFEPTTNILIYGHSMNNGTMFAELLKYKDYAFYREHKTIFFDTIYEHAEYEIIAVFQARVAYVEEKIFRYYSFIDTDSKDEFDDFIGNVKRMSYYDTGVSAEFGDSLITLSTCDREIKDGRLAIVARKITDKK